MKYTDDELAEAALLVAHTEADAPLPPALEARLLEQGGVIARDVRFTTTKAGAVEIEAAPVVPLSRGGRIVPWVGWLAAAACFAFAIYEWRVRSIAEERHSARGGAVVTPLRAPTGETVAELRDGRLRILHLAAGAGRRYQLWATASDPAHAVAVGSFSCEPPGCDGRELAVEVSGERSSSAALEGALPRQLWITTASGTEATPPTDPGGIIGAAALDHEPSNAH